MSEGVTVTRRGLITGAAVGGGLLVAWWFMPRNYPNPLNAASGEHLFDAWLKIAEDGVVSVAVPQLEMGQGITTLIPQIIAQELPLYPIWASPYHTVSSNGVGNAPDSVWGTSSPLDRVYLK